MSTSQAHIAISPSRSQIDAKFTTPSLKYSLWQIVNSLVPYLALNYLMYLSLSVSYWLTLGISLIAAAFLVRVFILFHDCGHGSFFKSMSLNKNVGFFLGLFSYTSFHKWRRTHSIHHGTMGNLDKRGVGDFKTLTVDEYKALGKWSKIKYRIYRNPFFFLGIGGILLFMVQNRLPSKNLDNKENWGVMLTNLALLVIILGLGFWIGFKEFFMIQLPIMYFASLAGVWLFYVQHQYERVEWRRQKEWNFKELAISGSSFLKLPKILQWFTGNIGYHHVHHLSPRIPNYYLEECHQETPVLKAVEPLTFRENIRAATLAVWDEAIGKLIPFQSIT